MIHLFTGAPGAGKTAALVSFLAGIAGSRPVFTHGLEGLTLPHTEIDATKWHELVPDGGILVVDEVQQIWRPTGPGVRPGLDIQSLETHRHRGIDVFLTTQSPALVHKNVRALVGRHVHIRDIGLLGRYWYEWPECSENVAWRTAPLKKKWSLPKGAFKLYKSASLHVKPVRSFPRMLVILLFAILAAAFMAWKVYGSIADRLAPPAPPAPLSPDSPAPVTVDDSSSTVPIAGAPSLRRVSVPHGSPAFHVQPLQTWPVAVAGCWVQADDCTCVTREEAPRLLRGASPMCLAIAHGDVQPPPGLPRPERLEPSPDLLPPSATRGGLSPSAAAAAAPAGSAAGA